MLSAYVGDEIVDNSVEIGYHGAATFQEVSGIVVSSEALDAVIAAAATTGWGLVAIGVIVAGVAAYNWYENSEH